MLACLWMSILALIDSFQNVLSLRVLFDYLCALSLRFLGIITSAWLILLINPSLVRYHLYNFFGWNFTLFFFVNSHHMNVIMTANSHDICNTNLQNFNIYIDYEFTTIFNLYFLSFYILYGMQIRVCFYFLWFPWSCVLMSLSPPFCASNFQQKRGWMLRFNGTLARLILGISQRIYCWNLHILKMLWQHFITIFVTAISCMEWRAMSFLYFRHRSIFYCIWLNWIALIIDNDLFSTTFDCIEYHL